MVSNALNTVNLSAVKWWYAHLPECHQHIAVSELLTVYVKGVGELIFVTCCGSHFVVLLCTGPK